MPLVSDPIETDPKNRYASAPRRYFGIRLSLDIAADFDRELVRRRQEVPSMSYSQLAEILIKEALSATKP